MEGLEKPLISSSEQRRTTIKPKTSLTLNILQIMMVGRKTSNQTHFILDLFNSP